MTIGDINPEASPQIRDVRVARVDGDRSMIRLEDDDPLALMAAVCILVNNGVGFVDGGDNWATMRKVSG